MIFVIAGPTCSGKSSLAIRLATAINGEIINGDAFQVYKELNIGTAKPSEEERKIVKHHLFDFISPSREYNVKDYQDDVRKVINELTTQRKNIIIVGGTGLYQKAALYDFDFSDELEKVDMSDLNEKSNEELYDYLKSIDEEATKNIHKNNRKRVLRAIEIYRSSGKTKSEIIHAQEHKLVYDTLFIGLNINRDVLYDMINARVDKMISDGLVEEVKNLKANYDITKHAFQAIGYKELIDYLDDKTSLEDAIELIKKHSRNYAKRQMTYFKNQLPMIWFDNVNDAYEHVLNKISK
ncbi:MAG: tRNA (adenosine(37)-N6)-dimethylallyltransferase MiaA [Erysipelotrichales bacterium]|nr:tRNA (adenosine(37)-N6)-dimethylallyltransferase MiaA [Erysipelotrichales bacterium]